MTDLTACSKKQLREAVEAHGGSVDWTGELTAEPIHSGLSYLQKAADHEDLLWGSFTDLGAVGNVAVRVKGDKCAVTDINARKDVRFILDPQGITAVVGMLNRAAQQIDENDHPEASWIADQLNQEA